VDPPLPPSALGQLITAFTARVPTVRYALVVSSDGVPVAVSEGVLPALAEKLSAITSGLISLAHGAARIFDGGAVIQALVAMERGTLVIMAIDEGATLAVLTTATVDLDLVAYEMTMLGEQAGSITPAATGRTPPVRRGAPG
jgi:predicted regulator of Ras-like GTPase activity (Roadblock/LC7/MglB family)